MTTPLNHQESLREQIHFLMRDAALSWYNVDTGGLSLPDISHNNELKEIIALFQSELEAVRVASRVEILKSLPVVSGILKEYDRKNDADFMAGSFVAKATIDSRISSSQALTKEDKK